MKRCTGGHWAPIPIKTTKHDPTVKSGCRASYPVETQRGPFSSSDNEHFMPIIIRKFSKSNLSDFKIHHTNSLDDTPLGPDASLSSNDRNRKDSHSQNCMRQQHKSILRGQERKGGGGGTEDLWHKYLYVKSSYLYTPFVHAYKTVPRNGTYLMLGSSHSKATRLPPSREKFKKHFIYLC
jgi:hypothetical protein